MKKAISLLCVFSLIVLNSIFVYATPSQRVDISAIKQEINSSQDRFLVNRINSLANTTLVEVEEKVVYDYSSNTAKLIESASHPVAITEKEYRLSYI